MGELAGEGDQGCELLRGGTAIDRLGGLFDAGLQAGRHASGINGRTRIQQHHVTRRSFAAGEYAMNHGHAFLRGVDGQPAEGLA